MVFLRTLVIGALLLSVTPSRSTVSESTSSLAHNNTIAIAVPLTDIQIDGDLTDWPNDLPIYKLRERWDSKGPFDEKGALLDTSADFSPHFRVGYNLQDRSLYVAIETRDDTLHAGDASELYLHTSEDLDQNPLHFVREYHEAEVDISDNLNFLDALFFTDERLAESGISAAVGHLDNIPTYEWSLNLSDQVIERLTHARSEVRLRFDLKLTDIDNDVGEDGEGSLYLSWSPNSKKDENVLALGGLVFAEDRSQMVQLQGTLKGEDDKPLPGSKIRVENPEQTWIDEVYSDSKGYFNTWALSGDLQVSVKGLVAADTLHLSHVRPSTFIRLESAPFQRRNSPHPGR